MRNRYLLFIVSLISIIVFSLTHVYFQHNYDRIQSPGVGFVFPKEDYIFALIRSLLKFIFPSFILGYLLWLALKKKYPYRVFYFTVLNFVATLFLIFININVIMKNHNYEKDEANIAFNKSLIKNNGGFLGSCIEMVITDLESQGIKPNDFRIISYSYDQSITTIPEDTTGKYYSFKVVYSRIDSAKLDMRAAAYLINFKRHLKRVYDVNINDEKADSLVNFLRGEANKLNSIKN